MERSLDVASTAAVRGLLGLAVLWEAFVFTGFVAFTHAAVIEVDLTVLGALIVVLWARRRFCHYVRLEAPTQVWVVVLKTLIAMLGLACIFIVIGGHRSLSSYGLLYLTTLILPVPFFLAPAAQVYSSMHARQQQAELGGVKGTA